MSSSFSSFSSFLSIYFPGPVKFEDGVGYTLVPSSDIEKRDEVLIVSKNTEMKKKGSFDVFLGDDLSSPPTVPYFLNPFILPNLAITMSFVDVGIAMYFLQSPVAYYLINTLNASAKQYAAYSTLINLPWSLKFVFGMISDGLPILGYRRKSWLIIGWLIFVLLNYFLAFRGQPSIVTTTVMMFLMTCAYLLSDVCTDTMCVERARFETDATRGTLQTSGYTSRAFGSIIGAILGAVLFNKSTWGWGLTIAQLFTLSALIPVVGVLLVSWHVEELASSRPAPGFFRQLTDIWETLQLRAVWRPMIFIFTYYVLQVPNVAWTNFLVIGLGFTDFEIGIITVASTIFLWFGMIVYKRYFFDTSWRKIYIYTTAVGVIFSVVQLLLVLRINRMFGIPDVVFAIGDTAIVYLMYAIQSMPSSIMFIVLCPEGSEGITYALLTTIGNLAWTVAWDLGGALSMLWDVSNATLESGDYSGMVKLTLLTSFLQLVPICLVGLLPDSKEEQILLRDAGDKSWYGGFWLSLVIVLSLVGTVGVNVWYLIF